MVIYMTINKITKEKYIGKDIQNNPNYLGSGINIKKAIKKYGKNNFEKIILEECSNKEELWKQEEYWLKKFNAENSSHFYNKTNKAFGNSGQTEEGKLKISQARKGWKPTKEQKLKMSKNRIGHKMYLDSERNIKIGLSNKKPKPTNFGNIISQRLKQNTNRRKSVLQYDKQGNFIKEWESVQKAAFSLDKKTGAAITEVCNGTRKSAYGYFWKYKK